MKCIPVVISSKLFVVCFILSNIFACNDTPKPSEPTVVSELSTNAATANEVTAPTDTIKEVTQDTLADIVAVDNVASSSKAISRPNKKQVYNLEEPKHVCNLPKELIEISALDYDEGSQKLIAVNDEKADIYYLNSKNCVVADKIDFGSNGDYEGIEKVGKRIYVLKANGDIISVNKNKPKSAKTYKTPLSTKNDVEGLGYDKESNQLILACKGAPEIDKGKKLKDAKAFYAFDLTTHTLDKKPKFVITDKALERFFKSKEDKSLSKKERKKLEKRLLSFSPSAIAKHPIDGYYYMLSSVGRLLIVCNQKGDIQRVYFLKSKLFIQPEGICFTPDGTMYVSNEGRSLVGKVMRFEY